MAYSVASLQPFGINQYTASPPTLSYSPPSIFGGGFDTDDPVPISETSWDPGISDEWHTFLGSLERAEPPLPDIASLSGNIWQNQGEIGAEACTETTSCSFGSEIGGKGRIVPRRADSARSMDGRIYSGSVYSPPVSFCSARSTVEDSNGSNHESSFYDSPIMDSIKNTTAARPDLQHPVLKIPQSAEITISGPQVSLPSESYAEHRRERGVMITKIPSSFGPRRTTAEPTSPVNSPVHSLIGFRTPAPSTSFLSNAASSFASLIRPLKKRLSCTMGFGHTDDQNSFFSTLTERNLASEALEKNYSYVQVNFKDICRILEGSDVCPGDDRLPMADEHRRKARTIARKPAPLHPKHMYGGEEKDIRSLYESLGDELTPETFTGRLWPTGVHRRKQEALAILSDWHRSHQWKSWKIPSRGIQSDLWSE